jgi:hypothetical protein
MHVLRLLHPQSLKAYGTRKKKSSNNHNSTEGTCITGTSRIQHVKRVQILQANGRDRSRSVHERNAAK